MGESSGLVLIVCVIVQFGPLRSLMAHAKEPLVFEVQLLKIR